MQLTDRDLGTLAFQARVLEEASREDNPLMERANFIGIASSNCEEFQRVRLPGLTGDVLAEAEGRLAALYARMAELYAQVTEAAASRITIVDTDALTGDDLDLVRAEAEGLIPLLRPVPPEEAPGSRMLLAITHDDQTITLLALPAGQPRLIRLGGAALRFLPVEKALAMHIASAFEGVGVTGCGALRILRDEHFTAGEDEEDVAAATEECLEMRRAGRVMRLLAAPDVPELALAQLCDQLPVPGAAVLRMQGCFHPGSIMDELFGMDGLPEWHYAPYTPAVWPGRDREDVLGALKERDRLLIHPYDSFEPVLLMLDQAAKDPDVRCVRMTLYRAKPDSRLVAGLMAAAKAGKDVDVLVETRARFDEARNLTLAGMLEDAGCRIISGLSGLKVHAKLLQVVRRERGYDHVYTHLGTGNYHEGTAKIYTDFGLMTADRGIATDVERVFAWLAGDDEPRLRYLTAAPFGMREEIIRLIRREMAHALAGRPAGISVKLNTFTDKKVAECLCDAARAGVKVDLTVRGACALQPGVPGVSEGITVRSIVGRFLEHGRMVRFENGGECETYISSADWMKRSFKRRVELLIPVRDEALQAELHRYITLQQQDTARAWLLKVDDYTAARCYTDDRMDSQHEMIAIREGE